MSSLPALRAQMVNTFPNDFPGVIEPHLPRVLESFRQVLPMPAVPDKVKQFVQVRGLQPNTLLPDTLAINLQGANQTLLERMKKK